MKKNLLLQIALFFNQLFKFLVCIGLLFLLVGFIHWHINPEFYNEFQIEVNDNVLHFSKAEKVTSKELLGYENIKITTEVGSAKKSGTEYFYLNDLNAFSRYFTYTQVLLDCILMILIFREISHILKSVLALKTFTTRNVEAFRRIGYFYLFMKALHCLQFLATTQNTTAKFNLEFSALIYILVPFILAEIFKEGNKLYEQDRLTI